MTKGNLRAAISRRYKGAIAERIIKKFPEFHNAQDFDSYVDLIEKLINNDETERLMRIAFDVFDYNQDRLVCELDVFTLLKSFHDDDEVFVEAFSYDLCILGEALDKRRKSLGIKDYAAF